MIPQAMLLGVAASISFSSGCVSISPLLSPLQALLHPYFFTPPLPAHHSELPIPTRQSKLTLGKDFDALAPIEESLVNQKLLEPYSELLCHNGRLSAPLTCIKS